MTGRPKLDLVDLAKTFNGGSLPAVDGINLSVSAGETIALLGSSGCGKSTTLNMVVGLDQPTSGNILIDGRSVLGVPAGRRDVGLVFQDYAVFTHMTVRQNLAFGLSIRKAAKAEVARAVGEVAELLGISGRLDRKAGGLGGSELQRVAIGRTLITRPSILLLDEPLSNLEADARLRMRRELRRLQKEIGLTIIYVTHDQVEALSLADRIAVMSAGKIQQVQDASIICDRPDTTFVAGFLGSPPMNLLRGRVCGGPAGCTFEIDGGSLPMRGSMTPEGSDDVMVLGLRPEAISLVPPSEGAFNGTVVQVEPRGAEAVVTFVGGGVTLKVVTPTTARPVSGEAAALSFDPTTAVLFSGETGRRVSA